MKHLVGNALKSACLVLLALAAAYLSQRWAVVRLEESTLSIAATAVFTWAAMMRLGWQQTTIDGVSLAERIDSKLFLVLSTVGVYLAALALA